jgi:hypothetical protein
LVMVIDPVASETYEAWLCDMIRVI